MTYKQTYENISQQCLPIIFLTCYKTSVVVVFLNALHILIGDTHDKDLHYCISFLPCFQILDY